jgi:murein DD-endopeptidase MepM/ murein hydrolase activator NlpD
MDFGDGVKDGAEERAPLAVAAALAVLGLGGAFLAFAMSRQPTAQAAAVTIDAKPPAIIASEVATPVVSAAAVPVDVAPSIPSTYATAPVSANEDSEIAEAFGGPIRVKPHDGAAIGETGALAPRLKPAGGRPLAAGAGETTVLSLASVWIAAKSDRPPPFFFASDRDGGRGRAAIARITDGDIADAPQETRVTLAKGETFVDALKRAGVRAEDRNDAADAFGKVYNLRRLRPGQELSLTISAPAQTLFQAVSEKNPSPGYLLSLDFRVDAEKRIALSRSPAEGYSAREFLTPLMTRVAAVDGRIDGSLYLSAKRQGAPDEVIAGLAKMFAYDVDFQREIFGGDEFEAIFEVRYDEAGNLVGGGDILFGRLKWRSRTKEKGYYRFETADGDGRADYFDASGESARRLLMKTPIDGARLSSGFGTRRHPILGYQKAHKGVDFAAARGTPIMAAGDGVVERAGPYGTFGNYVRIRHAQGYKTAYAHMNAVKKGVRTGVRVRQGDVIGYVGSTGRSTGPHLHYEVHLKDKPVNPQSLKIATGYELGGRELQRFREARDRIDGMRAAHANSQSDESGLLADNRAKDKAL